MVVKCNSLHLVENKQISRTQLLHAADMAYFFQKIRYENQKRYILASAGEGEQKYISDNEYIHGCTLCLVFSLKFHNNHNSVTRRQGLCFYYQFLLSYNLIMARQNVDKYILDRRLLFDQSFNIIFERKLQKILKRH